MVDRTEYEIDHVIAEGMESLLADIIQKYPVLYDKEMKHRYGATFQNISDLAWNKISDELNLELESCKSLWSCMKQKFIKHRKRLDNGEPVNSWSTFNKLHQWLDRHVKKRKSRIDYIKQKKVPAKTKLKCQAESIEDDDTNEPDEEWAELLDDKKTTVRIQLKRKSDDSMDSVSQTIDPKCDSKKKFNIEVISESGTTIYDDSEIFSDISEQKSSIKDSEIVVLEKNESSQIEVIEVKESVTSETPKTINDFDEFIMKIEQILSKHVHASKQKCIAENSTIDSNDAFGKYIASMVRELPSEKRMKIRLNILQYATELISKEGPN